MYPTKVRNSGICDIERAMKAKASMRSATWVCQSFVVIEDRVLRKTEIGFQVFTEGRGTLENSADNIEEGGTILGLESQQ